LLWTITVVLFLLWLLGLVSGHALGAWIHVLLILAIASLVIALIHRATRQPI
jgi:hypothetical protein